MIKKIITIGVLSCVVLAGCGQAASTQTNTTNSTTVETTSDVTTDTSVDSTTEISAEDLSIDGDTITVMSGIEIDFDKIVKDQYNAVIISDIITDSYTSKDNVDAQNGIKPIVYKQKGVYVFTLIQDPNPDKQNVFNLYGLSKESSITKAICIKIASLSWSQTDGLRFDGKIRCQEDQVDGYVNNYKQFDRISIHQGLLDKLYEMFGIKDKPQDKERLTRQFHQAFSNSKNENKNFLPGFCIHSGRSKPSQIDMPQKLPFIQYASIENAVLDCKYSLVELLDFARYE